MSPLRRSSRRGSSPASPARERSQRKAARGAFYTQYFEEGELGEVRVRHSPQEEDTYEAPHDATDDDSQDPTAEPRRMHVTRSGRRTTSYGTRAWGDDDEPTDKVVRPRRSTRVSKSLRDFVASDDEEEDENADYEETMHRRTRARMSLRLPHATARTAFASAKRSTMHWYRRSLSHCATALVGESGAHRAPARARSQTSQTPRNPALAFRTCHSLVCLARRALARGRVCR